MQWRAELPKVLNGLNDLLAARVREISEADRPLAAWEQAAANTLAGILQALQGTQTGHSTQAWPMAPLALCACQVQIMPISDRTRFCTVCQFSQGTLMVVHESQGTLMVVHDFDNDLINSCLHALMVHN